MGELDKRDVNLNQGNYNESIKGNYVQGNVTINEVSKNRQNLSSRRIYKIIENLNTKGYFKENHKRIIDLNLLSFYSNDDYVSYLLSEINFLEKRKQLKKFLKYLFYVVVLFPFSLHLYIIAITADLLLYKTVNYNLQLTIFHDFISGNQNILRYVNLFDFGLRDFLVESSKINFRAGGNIYLNSNVMAFLVFSLHYPYLLLVNFYNESGVHEAFNYFLNNKTDTRLRVFEKRLVDLLISKIDDDSN